MQPKRKEEVERAQYDLGGKADHEDAAFEKPTQIYKYLRSRNRVKPIFLLRTLAYMKHRMSRSNKSRKKFKVDSFLKTVSPMSDSLVVTFLSFYNELSPNMQPVHVESHLLKVYHNQNIDSCPNIKVFLGTSELSFDPTGTPQFPTVSIPTDLFKLTDHQVGYSYHLLLRVNTFATSSEDFNGKNNEQLQKKRKCSHDGSVVSIGTEVVLFDSENGFLLAEGDYEFYLEEMPPKAKPRFSSLLMTNDIKSDRQRLNEGPTLKFKLHWIRKNVTKMVDSPRPIVQNDESRSSKPPEEHSLVYQFWYTNNSKKETESWPDMRCIWCSIDCKTIASLLRHLKLCHPRFSFSCGRMLGMTRIDVTLNKSYDRTFRKTRRGKRSKRRRPLSPFMLCHPKRPNLNEMSEFVDLDENDASTHRPFLSGQKRLYYHSTTNLPIYPKEMDNDSEDERHPRILQKKSELMIDDFVDVNKGEKELMKMWNSHMARHSSKFLGDCHLTLACTTFVEENGKELLKNNLYRNLVLHMCSLSDLGLISPVTHLTVMKMVREIIQSDSEVNQILRNSWKNQKNHWIVDQTPYCQHSDPRPSTSPI